MIFLFFDNFVAYLYVNHSLSPEKQDYDMKRQEWLRKGRKTEKKERKVNGIKLTSEVVKGFQTVQDILELMK